jgi:hypothetical protein
MGDRRIAAVQTIYKGREGRQGAVGDPIMWSWGYNPAGEWGPSYQHGGDFMTAEECLSSFWLDLVTRLCDQIFEDREERIAHADLIKAHKQLLVGQAYEILDLIYLIDNLKEIIEGKVNPSVANTLRKDFPNIWKTLGDRKNDGLETAADLGDLGF